MGNDGSSQVKSGNSPVVAIGVALIGAVAMVGVAMITNWRNIFADADAKSPAVDTARGRGSEVAPAGSGSGLDPVRVAEDPPGPAGDAQALVKRKIAAERVVSQWIDAATRGEVDELIAVSATPFYFNSEVVVGTAHLRECYQQFVRQNREQRATGETSKIASFKSGTVHEFEYDTLKPASRTRPLGGMRMDPEDIVVRATTRTGSGREEYRTFFLRAEGDGLLLFAFGE